jgi:asparagine synthetase B (glutamine-hydrolysing)
MMQNMEQCSSHPNGPGDTSPERAALVAARTQEVVIRAMHKIGSSPGFDAANCFVLMSGGVDSAVVAKLAYELLGVRRALTVIASEAATDEPWAQAVAESLPGD